jgi:O-Antigen ligase
LFSSTPQSISLRSRSWGIALGTIIMVGVPLMIISAKTVQITLPLLLVAALVGAIARSRLAQLAVPRAPAVIALMLLIAFAVLSGIWSSLPRASASIAMLAAVVAVGSLTLMSLLRQEGAEDIRHIGEGLWIGLLVGALYTIVEVASGQALKIWAYNLLSLGPEVLEPDRYFTWDDGVLVAVHSDDLTRNAVPIPLLLWPALMGVVALREQSWRRLVGTGLVCLSLLAVFGATSETAKLALAAGAATFALARYAAPVARYAVPIAWIGACLAVIPIVLLLRHLEWQDASWLQLSAQMRIVSWNEIAHRVADAPWLGVGADMTYFIEPRVNEAPTAFPEWHGSALAHPHNVYLQVWYELGFVGALLLTAFGLALLLRIRTLDKAVQPYALALFSAAAVQIASSYNVWQIWFMCLFGFAAATFAVGQKIIETQNAIRI